MKSIPLPLALALLRLFNFPHKLGFCERLFGRALALYGTCWVQTGASISWKLDLTNPTHRWIVYGFYEGGAFLNWAREFLSQNAVIVDSGANIGQMLLYLAQWVPQGKVLAFEPGMEQADWLEECLAIHPTLPVEVLRLGLGASPTKLYLQDSGLINTGGKMVNVHGAMSQISETEGEPIHIVRLSDELTVRSISRVDLWKLDVEGYEIPALQGAESLLKEHRIKAIYVELHGENGERIQDYLAAFRYQCYLFDSKGKLYRPSQLPIHTNGLFLY